MDRLVEGMNFSPQNQSDALWKEMIKNTQNGH